MRMWVAIFELSQFCDTCANSCCSQIIKYIPYTDNVTSKTKRWERHQKKWNLVIHFGTNVWFTARLYECHSMISNIGKSIQLYRVRYFDDTTDKLVIPVFFRFANAFTCVRSRFDNFFTEETFEWFGEGFQTVHNHFINDNFEIF